MLKFNKLFFAFNIVIVFVIATVVIVYAWTNPSQNPPDGTGAITVDTNNNVGIGVTDPGTARLKSVTGEGNAGWFINNSPATYAALIVQNKGNGWGIYDNLSGKHYLAGSLGIGANPPSEKLDVAGYVKGQTGLCIGSDCRTAWPKNGSNVACNYGIANCVVSATDKIYNINTTANVINSLNAPGVKPE